MTKTAADDWPRRVAILGVGLLGGSVALSLRRARPRVTLVGLARSDEKQAFLKRAGIVDVVCRSIEDTVADCDLVVAAGPVDRIAAMVVQSAEFCPADCVITDVGSTKGGIAQRVSEDPRAASKFVAAHPIAGSEKTGAENAVATLFDGKVIILTPTDTTPRDRLEKAEQFWRLTGGQVRRMSPQAHDAHLAAVSHVPHLVSALVAMMADSESRPLVGSGWEDITRVAAGDPTIWTAICRENRDAVRRELVRFANRLEELCQIIDQGDDGVLWSWLAEAKRVKEQVEQD